MNKYGEAFNNVHSWLKDFSFITEKSGITSSMREDIAKNLLKRGEEVYDIIDNNYDEFFNLKKSLLRTIKMIMELSPIYLIMGELPDCKHQPAHLDDLLRIICGCAMMLNNDLYSYINSHLLFLKEKENTQ